MCSGEYRTCTLKSQAHSLPWEEETHNLLRLSLLTIIMSSERPHGTNRIRKAAGSFKGKLSSLLHLSRAPTPSSIKMDSSSDNPTLSSARCVTKIFSPTFHWNSLVLFKCFATQCDPCGWRRSRTYHNVCHGGVHAVPRSPNFGASFRIDTRAQATWFC